MRAARYAWQSRRVPGMRREPHRLVFIDETAVTTKMTRRRGRSTRGTRLETDASFGHWRTQIFIAGLRIDALSALWVLDGPINHAAFDTYIEPNLPPLYSRATW